SGRDQFEKGIGNRRSPVVGDIRHQNDCRRCYGSAASRRAILIILLPKGHRFRVGERKTRSREGQISRQISDLPAEASVLALGGTASVPSHFICHLRKSVQSVAGSSCSGVRS